MQMCPECENIYDESEEVCCPYCHGNDDMYYVDEDDDWCDDKGCDWYCDNCDAYMNSQSGFTTSSDEWTCTECGTVNDVSIDNIRE